MTDGPAFSAGPRLLEAALSPSQWRVVSHPGGPVLVIAGAGSGKTRTLVHRVAYLVQRGCTPSSILLLTFTRKAAQEMLGRAGELVGRQAQRVAGGTFHALANQVLRTHGHLLGYPANFGLMDQDDAETALGRLRAEFPQAKKDKRFPQKRPLLAIISQAANHSRPLREVIARNFIQFLEYAPQVEALAQAYQRYKLQNALMDFDDLLLNLKAVLAGHESARQVIAGRYGHILVDEYQDTNPVQAEITYLLSQDHRNVTAVGDDAQSIYAFRGASFRNIMDFPKLFPGAEILKLEENYRSRQPILKLANEIMARAREKYDKTLTSLRGPGFRPTVAVVSDQPEEARFVCTKVKEFLAQGVPLNRMAVLFRASAHSYDLEMELLKNGLDFIKFGGRKFLEAAHIKDFLAALKVAANPADSLSLHRLLTLLEGVGPKSAAEVTAWVDGRRDNLVNLAAAELKPKLKSALEPLAGLMAEIAPKGENLDRRLRAVWAFYEPLMKLQFDDWAERKGDIKELLRMAENYSGLRSFLADMTLEPPNSKRGGQGDRERPALTLSTIHSAKGLEWKVVFILSVVEGCFPASFAVVNPEELEEERRLLYVAITRAEDELFIMLPTGLVERRTGMSARPSRFLAQLPAEVATALKNGREIDLTDILAGEGAFRQALRPLPPPPGGNRAFRNILTAAPPPPTAAPVKSGALLPGRKVHHPIFGLGLVTAVNGPKATIDFDHFGRKTVIIEFAGLTAV